MLLNVGTASNLISIHKIVFFDPNKITKRPKIFLFMSLLFTNFMVCCQQNIGFAIGLFERNTTSFNHLLSQRKRNRLWRVPVVLSRPFRTLPYVSIIISEIDALASERHYHNDKINGNSPSSVTYPISFGIKTNSRNNDQVQSLLF